MSKYGYISLDMLYEYAMNTVDKTVSPNEFMRMPRANVIPIEWFKKQIDWHSETLTYGAEVYQWVLNRWYEDKEKWEKENE